MQSLDVRLFITSFLLFALPITAWGGYFVYNTAQSPAANVDTGINNSQPDTTDTKNDTLSSDTLRSFPFTISPDTLEDQVLYKSSDSSILKLSESKFFLYGNAEVKYQNIVLKAAEIVFDWSENTVTASGRTDSTGKLVGQPNFDDGDKNFDARKMAYNFKTEKGKIYDLRMKESEGYLLTREAKKTEREEIYARKVQYTTCDRPEPHFYLEANPSKVIPNQLLVSGPANLVIAGVRTPFVLPFALFPLKKETRQSGLILPQIASQNTFGFGLTQGGYYLALSDYYDLSLTADLYSSGSWGLHGQSNFKKRYKYSGNLNIDYSRYKTGNVFFEDLNIRKTFRVGGRFQLDRKAWPNNSFSINLNFGSSGSSNYNRYNETDLDRQLQSDYRSSISYSHTFPRSSPFNFQASARYVQKIQSGQIDLTLPEISTGMSQTHPFQREGPDKEEHWYDPVLEPINFSWNVDAKNEVSTNDSTFFTQQTLEKLQFGVRHRIPISSNYKVLKYINFSPNINYNENWYIRSYDHRYDPQLVGEETQFVQTDTTNEFNAVRYWSYSASFQTNMYGFLRFKNSKVKAIRHKVTPSFSLNYNPNFSDQYYQDVRINAEGERELKPTFPSVIGSKPPTQEFGGFNFSIGNNLEMKVADESDTVDGTRKVTIIDQLTVSSGYNLANDSLNWSGVNIVGNSRLFQDKLALNYRVQLDPYALSANGRKINTFQWDANRSLLRFESATLSMSTNFSDKDIEGLNIPLNMGLNYSLDMRKGVESNLDTIALTQRLRTNLSITPTDNWQISTDLAYNIMRGKVDAMNVNIRRDLHCWYMSLSWVPVGPNKRYAFTIQAKSSLLEDLKLKKQSDPYQNFPEFQ